MLSKLQIFLYQSFYIILCVFVTIIDFPKHYLLYRLESSVEVGNNVVNMLCAYGKTYRVGLDSLIEKLLLRELGMRCCRGVNYQRLHIGDIGKQREDFKIVYEFVRFLLTAFYIECKYRAAAVREILFV